MLQPVTYDESCAVGDCALGSLVADAMCAWASDVESDGKERPYTACLVPTRFLGAGLPANDLGVLALSGAVPPHPLVSLKLSAAQLVDALNRSQTAAWRACATDPLQQPGWQVSGLAFSRRCDGSRTRPLLYLRTRAGGALEKASSPSAIVPVITLRPALALLPPPAEPPRELGASAQRALADYVRAHTPFNYSAIAGARLQSEGCGVSACATTGRAREDARVGSLQSTLIAQAAPPADPARAWGLGVAAVLAFVAGAALVRRLRGAPSSADERRSFAAAQPAAPPPPVSAPSHRAEEAVPLRAAAPPVHREIKTGSVRLVDAAQLGD